MYRFTAGLLIAIVAIVFAIGFESAAQGEDAAAAQATIHVDLKAEKAAIPATLYGIFLEDIDHGVEGGLYGELIQNRSFEEGVLPPGVKLVADRNGQHMESVHIPGPIPGPWGGNAHWDKNRELVGWSLKNDGAAKGTMKLTEANPMNKASTRSLEIAIPDPVAGKDDRVALANSGFWGIGVKQDTPYKLRFFLRPGTFSGDVTATLESDDGKVLASQDFHDIKAGENWVEQKATLTANATDPKAHFVLSFRGQGTLQVDYVSLFPPTFKDRPNGARKDLAQYLADLKPAFVRWPGGCYVEGWSWESAPDFKRTLGPPEERPGMYQYWMYRSTEGFGFHEYLQFCEDIGAQPVYAVFGGMTVHPEDNVPLDKLDPYVQNALDAIEYATGPVTSKYGAMRAAAGHPEPFVLNNIEIGNEHQTRSYGDYYVKFRQAIKEKYPNVNVIMSMYWSGLNRPAINEAGNKNIDMIDEHAYHPDEWPRSNFEYFDRYERGNWPVFVGEYASQRGNGDWGGGLGDSLYLMMVERNGDLVKMACYAPLFRNVHDRAWPVNLIEIDGPRSFAHGSYYVQKVFGANRPDVNLATTVDVTPKADPNAPLLAGKIGLGSWNTQVEFKELRVYDEKDNLILNDDFANLDNFTTPGVGTWSVADGVLKQTNERPAPAMLLLKQPELKVGRITVKARRTAGTEGFLILFTVENRQRFLFANYGANNNEFSALQEHGVPEGLSFRGGRSARGPIENNRWYDIGVTLKNNSAEMFLDGRNISTARVSTMPSVFSNAGYDKQSKTVIVKATNYNATPMPAKIVIDGAASISGEGKLITVQGDNPQMDNSMQSPMRIVPKESTISISSGGEGVTVQLPPYSANVIRIPAE
ncbi:MAG TPA: alpha-L-arabinofuranosidase C-terminal domain-containing protein [Pirellulales bacterium]|jgi:alpha-L-arabinofuranosidase